MRFEINNLKQPIKEISSDSDVETVRFLAARKLKVSEKDIREGGRILLLIQRGQNSLFVAVTPR